MYKSQYIFVYLYELKNWRQIQVFKAHWIASDISLPVIKYTTELDISSAGPLRS